MSVEVSVWAINRIRTRVGESGITFKFGELKRGFNGTDDRLEQIGDHILGMHQLGVGHVLCVAGYVSQEKAALLWCSKFNGTRP